MLHKYGYDVQTSEFIKYQIQILQQREKVIYIA